MLKNLSTKTRVISFTVLGVLWGVLYLGLLDTAIYKTYFDWITQYVNPFVADFVIPLAIPNILSGVLLGVGWKNKCKYALCGIVCSAVVILFYMMFIAKLAPLSSN